MVSSFSFGSRPQPDSSRAAASAARNSRASKLRSMGKNYTAAVVPDALAGLRIDAALAKMFPDYSRNRLQTWLKSGLVRVDGVQADRSTKTMGGEKIELAPPPEADPSSPPAQRMELAIVFEDRDLIVLNKPA